LQQIRQLLRRRNAPRRKITQEVENISNSNWWSAAEN
jgi:hypothetical protein